METTSIDSIEQSALAESLRGEDLFDLEIWWATPLEDQINYLKEYCVDHPAQCLDLFSSFCSKYIVCGVSTIRKLLEGISKDEGVKPLMRLQAAQALLGFQEPLEEFDQDDPYFSLKQDELEKMKERNSKKKKNALEIYEGVVTSLIPDWSSSALPTPLKIQELIKLAISMPSTKSQKLLKYFKLIVAEPTLEESYRLKLIRCIPHDTKSKDLLFLYLQTLLWFMDDPQNRTTMRIVAAEMYLVHMQSEECVFIHLETWAQDNELDLMIRAQAIDVLLHNESYPQEKALDLFHSVQRAGGHGFGIYNDSQNVHQTDIEDGVAAGILKLIKDSQHHPQKENFKWASNKFINFIEECASGLGTKSSLEQTDVRLRNAKSALNRIELCTRLFCGKKASQIFTMVNCLIDEEFSKNKTQAIFLYTRLEEEMKDLIMTCATGIASRLINSLSSWKTYGLRISFKEQIKSCFVGRMNALIRELNTTQHSHPFFKKHMTKVVSIYTTDINAETNCKEKENNDQFLKDLESRDDNILKLPKPGAHSRPLRRLSPRAEADPSPENIELQKCACEDFVSSLFLQMDVKVPDRRCFSLFFGWAFSKISLELATEFKGFADTDQFQIALREAIDFYQGA